ncbi:MAG: cytochrome P450 [Micromonosporaceae bacterium]|nr:cytochrome P450 [Micromonosporaceae bacterium]
MTLTLTRHGDVTAILADRRFDVLAAPPAPHGLAWLRGAVSRFSRGTLHARRRDLATALLPPPAHLRAAATTMAADPGVTPHDVPVTVLVAALGARRAVHEQVAMVTPGYFGRVQTGLSDVDDAVEDLVDAFDGERTEQVAAAIGLLVQAHEATGGLVTRALAALRRWPGTAPVTAVLAETLRYDPPVPTMRRECLVDHDRPGQGRITAGTVVVLDVAAANRDPDVFADPDRFDAGRPNLDQVLTFGSGPRACPGRDHALALALGTVEGVLHRD